MRERGVDGRGVAFQGSPGIVPINSLSFFKHGHIGQVKRC